MSEQTLNRSGGPEYECFFHRNDKESIVNTMDLSTFQRQALYFLHLFNYLTLYMLSNIQHLVTSGTDIFDILTHILREIEIFLNGFNIANNMEKLKYSSKTWIHT